MKFKHYFAALRPQQWIKNLFVVLTLFYAKQVVTPSLILQVAAAFIVFCLYSSSVYLINDCIDRELDRRHPVKRKRPVASGLVSTREAIAGSIMLLVLALLGSIKLGQYFLMAGIAYWVLNLCYSLFIKKVVILDVIVIAVGFVLRVAAGGFVVGVGVPPSAWILLSTFFLALFLGFGKRRAEIASIGDASRETRETVLELYSVQLLDGFLVITATAAIMCYSLFTVSGYAVERFATTRLIYAVPFVVFGILRYLFLVQRMDQGEDPGRTLLDGQLLAAGVLWLVANAIVVSM